jgi:hypothetical protein
MKNFSKTKMTTAIAIILLMASLTLMALPFEPVQAETTYTNMREGGSITLPDGVTPDVTVETRAFLSFRPNPVGVGQTILVNVWLNPAIHSSRYFTDYTITITDPDGNEDVITVDSYRADTTAWFEYIVDQAGEWTLKLEFLGGYFPAGNYTVTGGYTGSQVVSFDQSCYYEPSETAEQTLTVQEDTVVSWPASSLPTDYWTRPVSPENREWASIVGDYPWYGPATSSDWPEDTNTYANNYNYVPYVQAPSTAHIVWKNQGALSGIIGGDYGQTSFTSGSGTPSIIYQGRAYQSVTKPFDGVTQGVLQCYDIRTGEVYWELPVATTTTTMMGFVMTTAIAPTAIEYTTGAESVPGASESLSLSATLIYIGGGRLIKYDPWTGAVSGNYSISPLTTGTYYMNGYALSVQSTSEGYRLINWTTLGSSSTLDSRIISNITWPCSNLPTAQYVSAVGVCVADFETGTAAFVSRTTDPILGIYYGVNVTGISLTTGSKLWEVSLDDETTYSASCIIADHGKVAFLTQKGYWLAYYLSSGKLAWQSETMDYPWDAPSFGAYSVQSAYGLLYRLAYSGVYAFDWDDGSIVWKYEAPTPYEYETPYTNEDGVGVYSFNGGGVIADGKLYTYNTEHTATQPVTRGWRLHCINATTGEGIWNITGSMSPGAVADGYLTASNSYDGYMYVFGKGQSATTIEAPKTAITLGDSVVLTGTVLDQSPAQAGTACVSAASMTEWMEYLHMQKSIPSSVTGVPVSLDALDSNGNWQHIGDVVTDGLTGTFGFTWEPEITGQYMVTATFMGDDSYGRSFATTYVGVVAAPEATPTAEPPQATPDSIPYVVGIGIAIILTVAVATVLILRKR